MFHTYDSCVDGIESDLDDVVDYDDGFKAKRFSIAHQLRS